MNRSEAVELMASRAHITKEQAEAALTALLDGMHELLKDNGGATLSEFEALMTREHEPDGSSVSPKAREADARASESKGSWDALRELSGCIEGPPDWAENHDFYLHIARTASYGKGE